MDFDTSEIDTAELELELEPKLELVEIAELTSSSTSEAAAEIAEPGEVDVEDSTSVSSDAEELTVWNGVPVAKTYLVLPVAVVVVSELYELV